MANFKMDDYVDVAERIRQFYERFPTGSLQTLAMPEVVEVNGKSFVLYGAAAYRTPDDERPAHGWAWEPVPGQTSFTRDSELQNAETSAWGRAIIALGFETKHIASQEEVRNRQAPPPAQRGGKAASPADPPTAQSLADRLATERTGEITDRPAWWEDWKAWCIAESVQVPEIEAITGRYTIKAMTDWITGGDTRSLASLQKSILAARAKVTA